MNESGIANALETVQHLRAVAQDMVAVGDAPRQADLAAALAGLDRLLEEARQQEEKLRRTEEDRQEALRGAQANLLRYQELFDFAPDGYLVTDLQAVIEEANHAAAAMLGTRKEFLAGKPLLFYVTEGDRRLFANGLRDLVQRPRGWLQWEMTLCPPRQEAPVAVLVMAAPNPAEGPRGGLRWVLRDVTRRKEAERTLRAEREFADSLVETAEAVVLVLDHAGHILRTNPYLRSLAGYRPGELQGRLVADLLVPQDRQAVGQHLGGLAVGGTSARGFHGLRTKDGRVRALAWSARALAGPDAHPLILLVGNDVTELQEAQRRALQAERLAAIGQMAAGLAHESRNALQRSQACLVRLGYRLEGQPDALDLLHRAQKAQEDLHRLYEGVREYAAPLRLEPQPCDLGEIWRQAWADLASVRQGKDAVLQEELGCEDLRCVGSPFHLKQVFRNLLENALTGGADPIRITVQCAPAQIEGRDAVQVAVEDNGPGFSEDQRQRAFEAFFTTKVRGTGLGLAICKRLVEAHGGRIALRDAKQPGGVIVVTLPRSQA